MFGLFKKKNKVNTRTNTPDNIDISSHGAEMEEIFSTKERKVRLTNTDPLTIPKQPRNYGSSAQNEAKPKDNKDISITNTTSVTTIIKALGNAFDKMDSNELGSEQPQQSARPQSDEQKNTAASLQNTSDIDFDDDFNEDDSSYSRLKITGPIEKEEIGKSILATGKIIHGEQQEINIAPEASSINVPENMPISSVSGNWQVKGRTSQMLISQIEQTLAEGEAELEKESAASVNAEQPVQAQNSDVAEVSDASVDGKADDIGNTHEFNVVNEAQAEEPSLARIVFNQTEDKPENTNEFKIPKFKNTDTESFEKPKPAVSSKGDSIEQQLANNPNKYSQIYENLYSKLNQEPKESRYEKFFGSLKPVAPGTSSEAVAETTRIEKAEKAVKPVSEKFKIPPYTHQSAYEYIPIVQMTTKLESVLREAYLTYSDKKDDDTEKKVKWDSSPYDFDPPQKFTITVSSKKIKESREKHKDFDEIDTIDSGTLISKPFKNVDSENKSEDEIADMPKFSNIPKEEPKKKRSFKLFSNEEDTSPDDVENMDKPLGMIDDFENPEDFKTVITEINANIHKLIFKTTVVLLITVALVALAFVQRFIPDKVISFLPKAPLMYAFFNFIALGAGVFICNTTVTNGISGLFSFKGNSDTVLSFTCIVGIIQSLTALFASTDFYDGKYNLYTPIIMFALLLNCIGKTIMMLRIRRNFKFVASKDEKYAAKIYNDEKKAQRLMVGIPVNKPIIAFQRKTGFLKNFLKLSYMPDPSEEMASRLTPLAVLGSIAVAVAYGFITKSVIGALSALCVVAVLFTPVAALIAINFPISKLCKRVLKSDAMMVGYPAVRQFSDCNAMMIDAKELYPNGSIVLNGIKTFNNQRIDDAILVCSAMFKAVDNTMAGIFDSMIKGNPSNLLTVDSVAYEDGDGLVGWANGDRVLVGSRHLLELHGIDVPDFDYEEKFRAGNRQVTYIAISGELIAMLITTYKADPVIASSLQRMEYNGMSFLVSTADNNITSERVSQDFGLFYRTVKILPHDVSDYCKNAKSKYEEKSRAYVATKGSLASLGRVISGCVAVKSRLSMSIIIQIISIILGVLTVSVLVLYSGLQHLGTIEILVYVMFWSLASIFAPQIYVDY